MSTSQNLAPNDWFEHPELLPPRPLGLTETKYIRRFAIDLHGAKCHDQYVFLAPNGLAVIGLAPSHPLVAAHRCETGYQPTHLRYIPPNLDHLKAEELVAAAPDDDGQEDAEAGASSRLGGEPGASGAGPGSSAAADRDGPEDSEALEGPGRSDGGGGPAAAAANTPGGGRGPLERPDRPPVPEYPPFPASQCARVNFEAGAARQQIGTKTSGKKRHRGVQNLRGGALLAAVERRGGGASFPIWFVLNSQLLEVNERLLKTPGLLYDRPCREGYVAILSPTADALKYFESRLVSEAEYLRLRGLTAEDLL
ncbi:hypothetical protein VOLCADRAFT_116496 [Volvox carteri f. nagariensis]|uniref:Protein Abitram n=1 Tax=Volvox carteri f. nagariensis TaxID=3068 RepID=D8TML5_VOLCA|nr:uncharacterized protein VOLCADRAFT_116496 [Volvox carteri f. nagariensis]EFJ51277.1 hypothetical protein VOLCADRAFT_116496 [Volvox carteri f. nagariensis]|eukprot:XP_002947744.1 hypothetical protein VOLCADRAFT_116496 [Volvox carteri f. nagariensis]